jgi:hypothetical protein
MLGSAIWVLPDQIAEILKQLLPLTCISLPQRPLLTCSATPACHFNLRLLIRCGTSFVLRQCSSYKFRLLIALDVGHTPVPCRVSNVVVTLC